MSHPLKDLKPRYVDRPDLQETFADSMEKMMFDGVTLRMEFSVLRLDDPQPPNPPTGTKHPVCRIVMPAEGAVELTNRLYGLMKAVEAQQSGKGPPLPGLPQAKPKSN